MQVSDFEASILPSYLPSIIKNAQQAQLYLVEPRISEIQHINKIILTFIKSQKRKIYGGYGLNLLILDSNPKDAIYQAEDMPDIDFYSPEPLQDLIELCNILHELGFKKVSGREAMHKETYSLRVNGHLYCDITYMPANIYHKIKYLFLKIYLCHPHQIIHLEMY